MFFKAWRERRAAQKQARYARLHAMQSWRDHITNLLETPYPEHPLTAAALIQPPYTPTDWYDCDVNEKRLRRIKKIERDEDKRVREATRRDEVLNWLSEARAMTDPTQRFTALLESRRRGTKAYLGEEDTVWCREELARLTVARADNLLNQARKGNAEALLELDRLTTTATNSRGHKKRSLFHRYSGTPYSTPDDWNEIVANTVKSPYLAQFRIDEHRFNREQLDAAVLEALAGRNLTDAKVALALLIHGNRRIERQKQLAELIEQLHSEKGILVSGPRLSDVPPPTH